MKNLFLIVAYFTLLPLVGIAQQLRLDVAYLIEGQFTDTIVDVEAHIVTYDRGKPGPIKSDWTDHIKAKVISQKDERTSFVTFTLGENKSFPDNELDLPWLKIYINNTPVYSDLSGKDYDSSVEIKYLCHEVKINRMTISHYWFFDYPVNLDSLPGMRVRIQNLLHPAQFLFEYLVTGKFEGSKVNIDAQIVDQSGKELWRDSSIVGNVEMYPEAVDRKWVTFLLGKNKQLPSIIFAENNKFLPSIKNDSDTSDLYVQILINKEIVHYHLKPYSDSIKGKYSLEDLGSNFLNWIGVNGYFEIPGYSPEGILICIRNRSGIE